MGKFVAFAGLAIVGTLLVGADANAAASYYNAFDTAVAGRVTSPGLTYPNLVTSGNKLTPATNDQQGFSLGATYGGDGTVTYISFLVAGSTGDRHELGLATGNTFGYREEAAFGTDGGSFKIMNGQDIPNGFATTNGGTFTGETSLIVAKIDQAANTLSLFANPTVGQAEPGTATVTVSNYGDFTFGSFRLANFDFSGNGAYSFDEVRVGATFADVTPSATLVPEPTALGLVAASGLLALRRRRAL